MTIRDNLLTKRSKNRPWFPLIDLRAIVLHWTAAAKQDVDDTRDWFESGNVYGSAHYIIGHEGNCIRCIPDDEAAYHIGSSQIDPASGKIYTDHARELFGKDAFSGKTSYGECITPNFFSIGIEIEPLDLDPGRLSEKSLDTAAKLCVELCRRYDKPTSIITTHHKVVGWKDCPKIWADHPDQFECFVKAVELFLRKYHE